MKNIRNYFVICLLFLLSSCMEDSALSDVEISDPSLIQPDISLYRIRDNSGLLTSKIEVFIWDKNYNSIELKKGSVSVNGQIMQLKKLPLTGAPYYTIDTSILKVELNKLYTFTISLGDGKLYQSSINTQSIDLTSLILPAAYNKQDNMTISWAGHDISSEFNIQLACDYNKDNTYGQTSDLFTPNQQERTTGTYVISKSYFNQQAGIYKATVTLTSKARGTVDSRFRINSTIVSKYIKESECNVN